MACGLHGPLIWKLYLLLQGEKVTCSVFGLIFHATKYLCSSMLIQTHRFFQTLASEAFYMNLILLGFNLFIPGEKTENCCCVS